MYPDICPLERVGFATTSCEYCRISAEGYSVEPSQPWCIERCMHGYFPKLLLILAGLTSASFGSSQVRDRPCQSDFNNGLNSEVCHDVFHQFEDRPQAGGEFRSAGGAISRRQRHH